jgi:hypothetical protein
MSRWKDYELYCDMMPCSSVEVHRRSGGTNYLHLQAGTVSQARSGPANLLLVASLAYCSTRRLGITLVNCSHPKRYYSIFTLRKQRRLLRHEMGDPYLCLYTALAS